MIQFDNYTIAKISEKDAVDIHKMMVKNTERFLPYFPKTLEQNSTLEAAEKFAKTKTKEFKDKSEFLFVIKEEEVIGLIYIKELDWGEKQGEFAYCIDKDYQGKGIITKVVENLTAYAFSNLGLETLQIIAHKDNISSVKVAENNNFIWQKTLLNSYTPPNRDPLDMELYELYKAKSLSH